MNAVTETVAAEPVSGVEIFVPLAKLKKSPRNARKVPHGEAAIEALAASIQHKGLIHYTGGQREGLEIGEGGGEGCAQRRLEGVGEGGGERVELTQAQLGLA